MNAGLLLHQSKSPLKTWRTQGKESSVAGEPLMGKEKLIGKKKKAHRRPGHSLQSIFKNRGKGTSKELRKGGGKAEKPTKEFRKRSPPKIDKKKRESSRGKASKSHVDGTAKKRKPTVKNAQRRDSGKKKVQTEGKVVRKDEPNNMRKTGT